MTLNIIGIHNTGITSSAALLVDGVVKFGLAEERFNRHKYWKYFPEEAIRLCLNQNGVELGDIDYFAVGWNPAVTVASRRRAGFSEWVGYPGMRLYSNPNYILTQEGFHDYECTLQKFSSKDNQKTITYVTHHLAHIANAFYLSPFMEAAVFSCDAYGERDSFVLAYAAGNEDIEIIKKIEFPHSIGSFYSVITEILGFRPDKDEWKVMGASAYGNPNVYYEALKQTLNVNKNADFELDLTYFNHYDFDKENLYSPKLLKLLGIEKRHYEERMEQKHFDLAAATQKILEDYLMRAVVWLQEMTGSTNLCLTGGTFMNSVLNGKIENQRIFEKVYIPFAPDDSGNCIGAALWVWHIFLKNHKLGCPIVSPYLGPEYSGDFIRSQLEVFKVKYEYIEEIEAFAAEEISTEKVVGWFQGRMEFGQRALGNRSILADPRSSKMKDRINGSIKFREEFRPFAPSVLGEHVEEFFEVTAGKVWAPFMEKVVAFRKDAVEKVPAVVHGDGTGRLHTVTEKQNPQFYHLIKEFRRITGVPMLLNTSFNINNEPIVMTPKDAIKTFISSGMDTLILGNYVIRK
jgi:carbamoyltransferase